MLRLARGILVLEKRPRWGAWLARACADGGPTVRPCRIAADVRAAAADMPGSVVVIDTPAVSADALHLTAGLAQAVPPARVVVLLPAELQELEWPFREFGAAAVVPASISIAELAEICRRLLTSESPREDQRRETP